MLIPQIIALAAPAVARNVRHWITHLGALGFIPLGLLDSSVIPIPGSMDVLTIVLAARNPELWLYYAVMATIGSVIGGFITYRIARKGGKETLERKLRPKTLKKVYKVSNDGVLERSLRPHCCHRPCRWFPVLLTAGAMQYSLKNFF